MGEESHLDDLVVLLREKRGELRLLGQKIAESARDTTIVFVDLSDSTAIKSQVPPDEWLGYVYEFVQTVAKHVAAAGGVVVKRIGDEVMLTFGEPDASEGFIDRLIADDEMQKYRFKVAADAGEVFSFQFAQSLNLDPYGQVVDRCARIAKLAGPGIVLCSQEYRERIKNREDYTAVGEFPFKGFSKLERVFCRPAVRDADPDYLEPLLKVLNAPDAGFVGYRIRPRLLSYEEIRRFPRGYSVPRPFLARELLNIPKLPMSPEEVDESLRKSRDPDRMSWYIGYLVEWSGMFDSFKRDEDGVELRLQLATNVYDTIYLSLALEMLEVVRRLKAGDRVFFRGIIMRVTWVFHLNYVEMLRVEPGVA